MCVDRLCLDGDGDLDAVIANRSEPNTVWLSDGVGSLTDTGARLASARDSRRRSRSGTWTETETSTPPGTSPWPLDGDGTLDIMTTAGGPQRAYFGDTP